VTAVRSAKQFLTYVASGPYQYAVAEALRLPDSYRDSFAVPRRSRRG
jgi:N-succinyldiaminopimelate aminotransferase